MTRYLCISVTLFDLRFHGRRDGGDPEWPPSPLRLFQALLAGARAGSLGAGWNEGRAAAFRWLERQGSPLIIAPREQPASRCTYFVPNNDSDVKFERAERLTGKIAQPNLLLDDGPIHYLWPVDENFRAAADSICREARRILALGWGIDQAAGEGRILNDTEVAALPGIRWRPWRATRSGDRVWRVPRAGSLDDLERAYESFAVRIEGRNYRPPLRASCFDIVHYRAGTAMPPRSYAAFELPDGVAFRQETANEVAAMLRSLACRCAREDKHRFPGDPEIYVAGHVEEKGGDTPPRFSYLPLPTIGHEFADGMIRRLLIAEPYDGDGAHARWARGRLRNQALRDHQGNNRGVLLDPWRAATGAVLHRYVGESRDWFTVTPVILPGFDDGKQAKAEKLLLQAVLHAGFPPGFISELVLRRAPFIPASRHPRQYHRPDYLQRLPSWHVLIRFHEPVPGPFSLGAGRHCGLGIFARMENRRLL